MGQAKQRGDKQARIGQAQARLEAIMPKTLTCETCQSEITDIKAQDSRNMPGIDGIFVGKCEKCGDFTQAVLGKKEAVEAFSAFMAEHAKAHDHAPALPRMPINRRRGEAATVVPSEDDIRADHAIPETATLLGYLVYLPDTEEYLAKVNKSSDGSVQREYAVNVHSAEVYSSYLKAKKVSNQITRDSEVRFLFDLDAELRAYSPKKLH